MKDKLDLANPQIRELYKRYKYLLKAANGLEISLPQFLDAVALPGIALEDEIRDLIIWRANKANNIITPVRAQDTGLIPNGWTIESDDPEGDVSLGSLDFSYCPLQPDKLHIRDYMISKEPGNIIFKWPDNVCGSLGLAAEFRKAQKEGKEIFPVESRGKNCFIMPLTILLDADKNQILAKPNRRVAFFTWVGGEWVLYFFWLDCGFNSDDRFVRRAK